MYSFPSRARHTWLEQALCWSQGQVTPAELRLVARSAQAWAHEQGGHAIHKRLAQSGAGPSISSSTRMTHIPALWRKANKSLTREGGIVDGLRVSQELGGESTSGESLRTGVGACARPARCTLARCHPTPAETRPPALRGARISAWRWRAFAWAGAGVDADPIRVWAVVCLRMFKDARRCHSILSEYGIGAAHFIIASLASGSAIAIVITMLSLFSRIGTTFIATRIPATIHAVRIQIASAGARIQDGRSGHNMVDGLIRKRVRRLLGKRVVLFMPMFEARAEESDNILPQHIPGTLGNSERTGLVPGDGCVKACPMLSGEEHPSMFAARARNDDEEETLKVGGFWIGI